MNDEDILGLNQLIESAGGLVEFTVEEQEAINGAGAEVLENNLAKAIRSKHYQKNRHVTKADIKHMADSVETGNLEDEPVSGDKAVGFTTKDANHARIFRMLSEGTKYIEGDNLYDEVTDNSADEVQEAKIKKLKEIMGNKEAGK
ncbi:HK97 gp10 family phage protein [Leuconostoc mesenteroides]|uniref:HK97 gp10 family phage protein n=1 Tax=Leuconostoc mesenteroides TaxID=1245 RepID=UPI00207321A1|nr:HK97 gp10 family phage protein [Leuconostoc mesenteroides]MCM6836081.1 HK97 gp10 family phage protein [Leuconostoc mesenteroides]